MCAWINLQCAKCTLKCEAWDIWEMWVHFSRKIIQHTRDCIQCFMNHKTAMLRTCRLWYVSCQGKLTSILGLLILREAISPLPLSKFSTGFHYALATGFLDYNYSYCIGSYTKADVIYGVWATYRYQPTMHIFLPIMLVCCRAQNFDPLAIWSTLLLLLFGALQCYRNVNYLCVY